MSDVMQGYDMEAAVSQIGKAICKAAKAAPDTAAAFARRASKRICATCTKRACLMTKD